MSMEQPHENPHHICCRYCMYHKKDVLCRQDDLPDIWPEDKELDAALKILEAECMEKKNCQRGPSDSCDTDCMCNDALPKEDKNRHALGNPFDLGTPAVRGMRVTTANTNDCQEGLEDSSWAKAYRLMVRDEMREELAEKEGGLYSQDDLEYHIYEARKEGRKLERAELADRIVNHPYKSWGVGDGKRYIPLEDVLALLQP